MSEAFENNSVLKLRFSKIEAHSMPTYEIADPGIFLQVSIEFSLYLSSLND